MDEAPVSHPKTEVSFAPTRAFVAKYGQVEADRQRKLFERPSWASKTACETVHPTQPEKEVLTTNERDVLIGFSLGLVVGVVTGVLLYKAFA